ncbi:DUF1614 domain-containing protein [Desulforhabdus sp. TSK]|uniref:DUF1614 domain-containing protein n=1 Tax=Desulforhabdus sp. TSK TaxID=2925014 RepID=UPI001FC880AA|nr:DUF1614 domain-containing protein [Desulforhabdus sp. TSK]GKT09727.1 membrane protein [Desulforhabdus sp. TSK]
MHYFPISLPFVLFFVFLCIFLVTFIEVGILSYAYQRMGIGRRHLFSLLLLSLFGSYINIPVFQLPPEQVMSNSYVDFFGVRHMIPLVNQWPGTVIAVNLGGAVIPVVLSIYLIVKNRLYGPAVVGIALLVFIVHLLAYPVRGVGIAVPVFLPPLAATAVAITLSRKYAPSLAYISGSMGTLIGADILNLGKIQGLGAPVASIGGAGTFDGIFLTGILAVLIAGFTVKANGGSTPSQLSSR